MIRGDIYSLAPSIKKKFLFCTRPWGLRNMYSQENFSRSVYRVKVHLVLWWFFFYLSTNCLETNRSQEMMMCLKTLYKQKEKFISHITCSESFTLLLTTWSSSKGSTLHIVFRSKHSLKKCFCMLMTHSPSVTSYTCL